jgi:hypothetical protein
MIRTRAAGSVQALACDPDVVVREKAAWLLGSISAPVSVAGPALQTADTSDPNPFVRSLAQVAISRLTQ